MPSSFFGRILQTPAVSFRSRRFLLSLETSFLGLFLFLPSPFRSNAKALPLPILDHFLFCCLYLATICCLLLPRAAPTPGLIGRLGDGCSPGGVLGESLFPLFSQTRLLGILLPEPPLLRWFNDSSHSSDARCPPDNFVVVLAQRLSPPLRRSGVLHRLLFFP